MEQTKQNHNQLLDEIKTLKAEINVLKRDRVIFDNVFKDLEKDLKLKEVKFKKVLYEFVQVQLEKDIAEQEVEKIKIESEKEMKNFSNQYDQAFYIPAVEKGTPRLKLDEHFSKIAILHIVKKI